MLGRMEDNVAGPEILDDQSSIGIKPYKLTQVVARNGHNVIILAGLDQGNESLSYCNDI